MNPQTFEQRDKRYIPTRVIKDKRVPKRYQRSGWIVFDTDNPFGSHYFVETRKEALETAKRWNEVTP